MKNILILGANGKIARIVEEQLRNQPDYRVTLVLRQANRLARAEDAQNMTVVEGDSDDSQLLDNVLTGQDIVYANLNGHMETHAQRIVEMMQKKNVNQLVWITGSGLYHETPDPFGSWVENYVGHASKEDTRRAAKIIEASELSYTLIRAAYMTNDDEVDYELTHKGDPFKGTMVSRTSIADLVMKIIAHPADYNRESLGISKPGTDQMLAEIRKIEHDL